MSPETTVNCSLPVLRIEEKEAELEDGSKVMAVSKARGRLVVRGYTFDEDIILFSMLVESDGLPVIRFGQSWLPKDNPVIDWQKTCSHINGRDGKQ